MIFDYGIGNIFSLKKAFEEISGSRVIVRQEIKDEGMNVLILPGVGNFRSTVKKVETQKKVIDELVEEGLYIFGICLGMQLLGERSEESEGRGLGFIRGRSLRLPNRVKVPHIGWDTLRILADDPLLEGIKDNSFFYFAHSYFLKPIEKNITLAETNYGTNFPSIIKKKSIIGVQFHPEKSGKNGLDLIRNFIGIVRK